MASGPFTSRFSGASGGTDPNAQYMGTVTAYNELTKEAFVRVGYLGSSMRIKNIVGSAGITGVPQVGDSVVVSFLNGHINEPVIIARINTPGSVPASEITADAISLAGHYLTPYTGFRNAIINGDFRINQRAWSSSTTSNTYGYDRWKVFNVGGTVTMSSQQFTVGSPAAAGYESPNFVRIVTASQSASGDYAALQQPIEDARTFANSTVTISFWAKASSGTPKVAIELAQVFGTGGSPSADVNTLGGQVTLSTSWARYSVIMTVPNINGKTFGTTANTSSLNCNLWVSAGSTFNARLNSIGIQNNTFDLWGVQVERGSVATPFEQRPIGAELALCQRYYFREADHAIPMWTDQNGTGSQSRYCNIQFPVRMRTNTYTASATTGGGAATIYYKAVTGFSMSKTTGATTLGADVWSWTIDAEF